MTAMTTPRRHRYVRLQVVWLLGVLLALVALEAFSYGAFVLLAVLGLLVGNELLTPVSVDPRWRPRLRWLTAVGLVVAGAVVVVRTAQLLAPGAIP
jgi:hypothetical protein